MNKQITNRRSPGVTLIELLVVISVLVVLMALMVPRVRMVTKDRSIRESARIVGAALNEASSKATVDGFAGIAIMRSPNVRRDSESRTNIIYYAGYQMFQLRQPPSYVGLEVGDVAQVFVFQDPDFATNTLGVIEVLFREPPPPSTIDLSRGYVRLNGAKTLYRIIPGMGPNGGRLCEVPFHLEMPAVNTTGAGVPFEVIREPVLRQTSRIDLPRGYLINLNYSGPVDVYRSNRLPPAGSFWDADDWTWTAFSQSVPHAGNPGAPTDPIYIIFNDQGGIDRIYPNGFGSVPIIPNGSIHLCVAPDDIKHTFQPNDLSQDMIDGQPADVLDDASVMWVSINHINGSVTVTDTTRPTTMFVFGSDGPEVIAEKKSDRLLEALQLTGKRQASTQ